MPLIHNQTADEFTAPTGHVIPAGGSLPVSIQTLERLQNEPVVAVQFRKGNLRASADPVENADGEEITRSAVARANKDTLIGMIKAAGSEYDEADLREMKVEDTDDEDGLRSLAARLVFGDD